MEYLGSNSRASQPQVSKWAAHFLVSTSSVLLFTSGAVIRVFFGTSLLHNITCLAHASHTLVTCSYACHVLHDCIAIVITDMPCSPHVLIADLNAAEHSQVLSHGACGVSTLCICCVKALQHDQHTALVGSERQAGNATMVMFVYKHTYC